MQGSIRKPIKMVTQSTASRTCKIGPFLYAPVRRSTTRTLGSRFLLYDVLMPLRKPMRNECSIEGHVTILLSAPESCVRLTEISGKRYFLPVPDERGEICMRAKALTLAAMVVALGAAVSSCLYNRLGRAEIAADARQSMIGMTKEKVLACMGPPERQATVGDTEVWSYSSGGDTNTSATATASSQPLGYTHVSGSAFKAHRYCVINIVLADGRVSAVNYAGRTGGWASQGEQCAFAVRNCAQ